MLYQKDIDALAQSLQNGEDVYLYYVAHKIETREGFLDEHIYKSVDSFIPVKVKLLGIQNAYFEYLNYVNHPENFHVEEEEVYYDIFTKYIHYYVVPNSRESYTKTFNSNVPSIIYGVKRKIYRRGELIKDYLDPTPIKVVYTNYLEFLDQRGLELNDMFNSGNLDWKYKKLTNKEKVDGIEFDYITSDWYILDIENFPRTEMPLINTKQYCAYFRELEEAFNYIDQLEA